MLLRDLIALLFNCEQRAHSVAFRVDAGRVQGLSYGHLSRCCMLSRGIKKHLGMQTVFLMKEYADGINWAKAQGENVALVNGTDTDWIGCQQDVLVFDLPRGPSPDDLEMARLKKKRTIVIDDLNTPLSYADVILNSSILAVPDRYPAGALQLLGPDYFIMDERFSSVSRQPQKKKERPEVLVTFGGSDPAGITREVLLAMRDSQIENLFFNVILGPGFAEHKEIDRIAPSFSGNIRVHSSPEDLLPFYLTCDFAICAGGRTLYELQALKIPALAIASIDHERSVVKAFAEKGLVLGGLQQWNKSDFLSLLHEAQHLFCKE